MADYFAVENLAAVSVTAATAVQLNGGTSKPVRAVIITADAANTDDILVGNKNVSSSLYIKKLAANATINISMSGASALPLLELSSIWLDADSGTQTAYVHFF